MAKEYRDVWGNTYKRDFFGSVKGADGYRYTQIGSGPLTTIFGLGLWGYFFYMMFTEAPKAMLLLITMIWGGWNLIVSLFHIADRDTPIFPIKITIALSAVVLYMIPLYFESEYSEILPGLIILLMFLYMGRVISGWKKASIFLSILISAAYLYLMYFSIEPYIFGEVEYTTANIIFMVTNPLIKIIPALLAIYMPLIYRTRLYSNGKSVKTFSFLLISWIIYIFCYSVIKYRMPWVAIAIVSGFILSFAFFSCLSERHGLAPKLSSLISFLGLALFFLSWGERFNLKYKVPISIVTWGLSYAYVLDRLEFFLIFASSLTCLGIHWEKRRWERYKSGY